MPLMGMGLPVTESKNLFPFTTGGPRMALGYSSSHCCAFVVMGMEIRTRNSDVMDSMMIGEDESRYLLLVMMVL